MERSVRLQWSAPLPDNRPFRYDSTDAPLQNNGASVYRQPILRYAERCHRLSCFGASAGAQQTAFSVTTERSFVRRLCLEGFKPKPDSTTKRHQKAVFRAKTHFQFVLIFHSYLEKRATFCSSLMTTFFINRIVLDRI